MVNWNVVLHWTPVPKHIDRHPRCSWDLIREQDGGSVTSLLVKSEEESKNDRIRGSNATR
jgi:hypothetical protein